MKNTNTTAFRETVFSYFVDSIYEHEPADQAAAATYIRDRFESEYNYPANRVRVPNTQKRIADWLSGLPLNIDYTYCDIRERAEKWHGCKLTDKQADMVQERWFAFLALKLMQLFQKHRLTINAG